MTSPAPVFDRPTVDWERDGYQRPKIKPPTGETWPADAKGKVAATRPYTRVTTFAKALDNGHALGEWKARQAVLGMGRRPDYVQLAAALTGEERDKRALQELADKAREAAGPNKADMGTALHAFTERLDRGEDVGHVPEAFRVHLDNYRTATRVLSFTHYEVRTVCDELETAGTPDRLGWCSVPDPDGIVDALRVIDTKTGRVDYPASMTVQLSIYWKSDLYDPATGARTRLAELGMGRWGIIVHLDALTGACELYWINLEAGWTGAQLAGPVRAWNSYVKPANVLVRFADQQPATVAPVSPIVAAVSATVDPVVAGREPVDGEDQETLDQRAQAVADAAEAIAAAVHTTDLAALWQAHGASWDAELQQLAAARYAELEQAQQQRAPRAALAAALEHADGSALQELWAEHGTTPLWTDEHSAIAERRFRELTAAAA